MKVLFTLSILFFVSALVKAQSCLSVHTGNFKISDSKTGVTIIARNEKYQIEENVTQNFKIMFSITWTDDCTYELRPVKCIAGSTSSFLKGTVVTAKIIQVKSHGYQAVCTTNFSDYKETLIVEMIE
jgi:hypothetical protein